MAFQAMEAPRSTCENLSHVDMHKYIISCAVTDMNTIGKLSAHGPIQGPALAISRSCMVPAVSCLGQSPMQSHNAAT
jgi:hypothetical protein